ncbi:MAG: hydrogenase maturation protease [Elusimicrobiota bacterium]|nr:hydrogenase maturation protease [Endomicrobiia bacterium]MDW8165567.1 hydrogenase maturation protease [Elusimicrobiota bacterium]
MFTSLSLEDFFSEIIKKKTAFVGLGNFLRSDDAVGCYVVEKIREILKNNKNFLFINAGMMLENYLNKIIEFNPEIVLFVDALRDKNYTNDFYIFTQEFLHNYTFSTHTISLATLIEYLNQQLNKRILYFILGIKVESFDISEKLTDITKDRADKIVEAFLISLKKGEKLNYA